MSYPNTHALVISEYSHSPPQRAMTLQHQCIVHFHWCTATTLFTGVFGTRIDSAGGPGNENVPVPYAGPGT
jgi:hypothetical protein